MLCRRALAFETAEQVASLPQVSHLRDDPAKLVDCVLIGVERGVSCGQALERGAGLEDLDRLALGDAPDARAAMALALDEPVVLKSDKRHAHGRPTEPELRAQVLLEQPLTGQQLSADNRVAQILVTVGPERQPHLSRRIHG
jgi:hypothetical protein